MVVNGIHYHVETHGRGDPLVLLHGFTGSGVNWTGHTEVFAQYFQVITIDLLGHGQTDAPVDLARYRIESAASDLVAILDKLSLDKVTLLGYSMGGRLALYAALTSPVRISR